jgi:hypothetical protein
MADKKVITRLPVHKEKKLTFTKIIVLWSMLMTTVHYFIAQYFYYFADKQPSSVTSELIQILIVGVILGYMGKSGFEFYHNKKGEIATMTSECEALNAPTETNQTIQ